MPKSNLIARFIAAWIVVLVVSATGLSQSSIAVRILKAEDERRWDNDLKQLLSNSNAVIRKRAALAAGRIGNEDSVSALAGLLQDADTDVRAMAAFAIGEVEAASGADPLLAVLKNANEPVIVRARALEALGKIAGTMPREQDARRLELGAAIIEALKQETAMSDRLTAILGLTAALRARPANAGPTIARFLAHSDPRVRADAGNTLARLRLNHGNDHLRKLLTSDADPIVRANAARVLGITEDKPSFDVLLKLATDDPDSRVRVGAIRSLALLKDARAAETLLTRGEALIKGNLANLSTETNEVLEIAATVGRLLALKENERAITWLGKASALLHRTAPEVEVARARIAPAAYVSSFGSDAKTTVQTIILSNWRAASGIAAGFGEIATLPDAVKNRAEVVSAAESSLRAMLDYRNATIRIDSPFVPAPEYAVPDVLRALAAFRPRDFADVLLKHLDEPDVIVRGTAADLLGDLVPAEQFN